MPRHFFEKGLARHLFPHWLLPPVLKSRILKAGRAKKNRQNVDFD
jgi:hypothetical protein